MLRMELDDVSRPQVLALVEEHLRNMYELSPPEMVFAFDAGKLNAREVSVYPAGFERCEPFGPYRENGNSVFVSFVV